MDATTLCITRIFLGCGECKFFLINEKNEPYCEHFDTKVEKPKVIRWKSYHT